MEKDKIKLNDIYRILIGEAPLEFLAEVLFRSIFVYLFLLAILRLLGKRMSGKLSNTEMAVMLMFGAIVSSAMQIPDRGMLEGCFVLILALALQRGITWISVKHPKFEYASQGRMTALVTDGTMNLDAMKSEDISITQLGIILRGKGVFHLGLVKRLYMETSGSFSLYKQDKAGLTMLATDDKNVSGVVKDVEDYISCEACGKTYELNLKPKRCDNCRNSNWVNAVEDSK